MTGLLAQAEVKGPEINWEALSPALALTVGACVVLMVGLARSRFVRGTVVPVLTLVTLAVTAGLCVWQWDINEAIIARALVIDNLTLTLTCVFVAGGFLAVFLSWRSVAASEAGEGEYFALMLTSILGMFVLVAANDLVVLFIGFELLSIPLYVLCATHMRREQSLESGLKYLIIGSLGSATLLYGLALLYGAAGGTNFDDIAVVGADLVDDPLFLTGIALVMAGLAFKASVAPFHQWTPDVYEGAPTPVTGFMAVATKAAAFGIAAAAVRRRADRRGADLGAGVRDAGRDHDRRRQRGRDRAVVAEAPAGLLVGRAGGLHARRRRRDDQARHRRDRLLSGDLRRDEPGRVRGDRGARARDRARRRHLVAVRARRRPARPGVADDDRDARAGRLPGDGGLLREDLPDQRVRGQRLRVARRRDRARVRGVAGVLPAGGRGGVDALAVRGAGDAAARAARDRGRLAGGRRRGPRRGPRTGRVRARHAAGHRHGALRGVQRRSARRRRSGGACASPRSSSSRSPARS